MPLFISLQYDNKLFRLPCEAPSAWKQAGRRPRRLGTAQTLARLLEEGGLCESAPMLSAGSGFASPPLSGSFPPWDPPSGSVGLGLVARSFGPLGLCVALVLGLGAGASWGQEDRTLAPTRDLERVEQRLRALQDDLAGRERQRQTVGDEIERSDRDIGDLARAGHELGLMLAEQHKVKLDLEARLTAGRLRLAHEREVLANLVVAAYKAGRADELRLLLDRTDVQRLDRVMAYCGYLGRERRRRTAEVGEQARELERLAGEAAEESERLARMLAQQEEVRRRLMVAREERIALLAELDRGIAMGREDVADLSADADALRLVIEQLARQAQIAAEADLQQVPLAQRRGKLPWPLPWGSLLAEFNAPKGAEGQRWDGVVLATDEGAEVRAVHHGRIVYADWLRGFGLLVVIDHDDGYMTLYGNNQTLLKEIGEWVGAGDVIALSGSSGGQHRGQLYFAIRHRGQPQDPGLWCTTPSG